MISFLLTLLRFLRAVRAALKDEEFRAIFVLSLVLILVGTVFYSTAEGWSIIDALYFSVITLTTVGFGDLHPTSPWSKAFTVVYVLLGIGVLVALVTKLAQHAARPQEKDKAPGGGEKRALKGKGGDDR